MLWLKITFSLRILTNLCIHEILHYPYNANAVFLIIELDLLLHYNSQYGTHLWSYSFVASIRQVLCSNLSLRLIYLNDKLPIVAFVCIEHFQQVTFFEPRSLQTEWIRIRSLTGQYFVEALGTGEQVVNCTLAVDPNFCNVWNLSISNNLCKKS